MDISNLFSKLDISTLGIVWARITGGWKGVAVYICKAFTALLKKIPADQLKQYSELVQKVMELVKLVVEQFVPDEYKAAGELTVEAIATLCDHIKDGEYTEDELDADVDHIEACIDAWRSISK